MSITLTGTGGLFTRLGKMGGILNYINLVRGNTGTPYVPYKVNQMEAQFQSVDQNLADLLYTNLSNFQQSATSYLQSLQTLAQSTLIQMVNEAYPLSALTVANALTPLISQMVAGSNTIQQSAVTTSVTAGGTNTGNALVVMDSPPLDQNGNPVELSFPEALTLTITSDAGTGATAGQESFSVVGQAQNTNTLDFAYPGGSGSNTFGVIVNPAVSNTTNLLYNSEFETWTVTNIPDGFTIGTGAATVTKDTSHTYGGSSAALAITSDGSTLTSLTQQLNLAPPSGSISALAPRTKYAFEVQVQCSAAAPAAGVLTFSLVDGSGTVLNSVAGVPNTITISHAALTTSYQTVSGFFETPAVMPATYYLRIKETTALTNTDVYYIDHMALAAAQQLYTGGPFLAVFTGSTNVVKGDNWTLTVANTYGGFQQLFDKFFGTRQLGLLIPSSGSPSISDSLIA